MALDAVDNKIIRILLTTAVKDKTDVLKISYDGVNGTIRSVYNVKVATFSEKTIVNRYLDPSLLVRKMQINLCTDTHPSGFSSWTDINMTPRFGNTSNSVTSVRDTNNVDTGYNFTFIEHYPDNHLQNIVDITGSTGNISTADPLNSLFPLSVRAVNAELGSKPLIFALLKVDSTKVFNVITTGWEYGSGGGDVLKITGNDGSVGASFQPSANIDQFARINNLKSSLKTLPDNSGTIADGYDTNKIIINCNLVGDNKAAVCGFIIEECIDN